MKKPAKKKKAVVPPKKTGQGKRASVRKASSSITEVTKKGVKKKPADRTTRSVKRTKTAAKPSAKSAEKTKKSSIAKKTGSKPSKTRKKVSVAAAKTTSRVSAKRKAPPRTAAKTTPKKLPKKPADIAALGTKLPAKKTTSPEPKKKASRGAAVTASQAGPRELPREYGENEVVLMSVDPHLIFVDWEIKKEQVPDEGAPVTMRVFGIAPGEGHAGVRRDRFFELQLDGRVGSGFFEIRMPGREIAIEIGLYHGERFSPILKSEKVTMPELGVPDELGIAQKVFESGVPVGY